MKGYVRLSAILFTLIAGGHLLARIYRFYFEYWWFDILLHVLAGAAMAFFWLWLTYDSKLPAVHYLMSTVAVAVLGSFLWEIWEYSNWRAFPWTTVYIQDVADTLGDISSGLFGGAVVSILHLIRLKK